MADKNIDNVLIERVKAGEKRAFDMLVLKYQHKVINLVSRYTRDLDEAQDIAQEAFIKAYRALPGFRGDSAFYTWLYRIAINTAKNYLQTQKKRPVSVDVEVAEVMAWDSSGNLRDFATPEKHMQRDDMYKVLQKALDLLPEDLRSAITLREMEGLSYDEIALVLDCPVGTVRSRIFRARESLDRELKPLLGN